MPADPHPPSSSMSSVVRDVKNVAANGGASVDELREFLSQLKGKNPAEMLGTIAQSHLVRCTVQATVLIAAAILLLTAAPFAWGKVKEARAAATAAAAIQAQAPDAGAEAKPDDTAPPGATNAAGQATGDGDPPKVDDLLDTLNIGETKTAPLDINPLDAGNDDLFDELK